MMTDIQMAFISGHLDITQDEFDEHYREKIDDAVLRGYVFVIGDARGADLHSQSYLNHLQYRDVVIYHIFGSPRNNIGSWPTIGGFTSDDSRDAAMTAVSFVDIAWLRDPDRNSGTRRNIERRARF